MNALAHMTSALLITYTLFPDVTPVTKQERADVPWETLVENIRKAPTYISKGACPLISLGEYGEQRTDKDCLRHAANVQRVFGVELDYDGEQMPIEEAAAILQGAGICAVLYTSPSHTPQRPRWRAILPLSEPALPDKRREYVGRTNRLLGGIASRESFTLSQSFYLGRVRGAEYQVIDTTGRYIDLASDIEPRYYDVGDGTNGESARDLRTDDELRDTFQRGIGRYESMLKLSSRWAAKGLKQDDIESALNALLSTGDTHNTDGIDLRTRIRPLAESAVRKFGGGSRGNGAHGAFPELPPEELNEEEPPDPYAEHNEKLQKEREADKKRKPMDWEALADQTPPVRSWRVSHWLTSGPTLLAGTGGIGKTLIAQTMATALALGRRFIDDVHESSTVLFWACEDDHNELWRRQIAICKFFGVSLRDLDGKLIIEPRLGQENTLFTTVYGAPAWTALRDELADQVGDYKSKVLFLDNIGQTFGAKENDRHHVTMFLNGLIGLGDSEFATVVMGHPSKTAGSEFSGSTAWENAVRMRWFMGATLPDQKEPEAEEADPNIRYLAKRKTNYTLKDYRKLEYREGVFVPEDQPSSTFSQRYGYPARVEAAQDCVLYALGKFQEAGVRTSDARTSPDYLPKRMRDAKLAADYSPKELAEALMKLRLAGRIGDGVVGKLKNRTAKMGLVCVQ